MEQFEAEHAIVSALESSEIAERIARAIGAGAAYVLIPLWTLVLIIVVNTVHHW